MKQIDQTQSASAVREACRAELCTGPTSGLAAGFTQANLVILPSDWAEEFHEFCRLNPKPCPLLDVLPAGDPHPRKWADNADIRTDLPAYRVWKHGELVSEVTNIVDLWQDDFVSFLIGCSFTFESALLADGLPVRHIELGTNVPMYRTNQPCTPAGRFQGNLVVSMRPFQPADAIRAVEITSQFPQVHGSPVHIGLPEMIGIHDLHQPDFGDPVPVHADELPVFWACGVTPQAVLMESRPPLVITHSPGCMFVTDRRNCDLRSA